MCENDAVDSLEPNYPLKTPPPTLLDEPDPDTTEAPTTDSCAGSGNVMVPTPPTMISSGSGNFSLPTCTKLLCGELLPVNNYLVMINFTFLKCNIDSAHKLEEDVKMIDLNFDTSKIRPIVQGSKRGFYYNGLSKDAVMKVRIYGYFLLDT